MSSALKPYIRLLGIGQSNKRYQENGITPQLVGIKNPMRSRNPWYLVLQWWKMVDLFLDCYKLALSKKQTMSFITAGGGAGIFGIFQIPGISKVMIEARMLYHASSFAAFLEGGVPEQYVSPETADLLALTMSKTSEAKICFALTCSLQTDRKRKGKNHGYFSLVEKGQVAQQTYFLVRGKSRTEQDLNLTQSVLFALKKYLLQCQ